MPRITAFLLDAMGHIAHTVPVLQELRRRGHRAELTLVGDPTGAKEIGGIKVRRFALPPPRRLEQMAVSLPPTPTENFALYGAGTATLLEGAIARSRPDFILIDPMLWGALFTAEAKGISWGAIAYDPTYIRGREVDVRGPGYRPPRTVVGRTMHRVRGWVQEVMESETLDLMNDLRGRYELPELRSRSEICFLPPLTIATTAEPFEYPRKDWPSSIRFVGPLSWEPPGELPDWIRKPDDRPLILLAGSSVPKEGIGREWARIVLEALEHEPYRIVATLPTEEVPPHIPANARIVRFLPHSKILPRTACVICHGGLGITQKALAAGVPVVAIPLAYEFEIARRVEVAKAGVRIPARKLTADRLRAGVRSALSRKGGAERIAEAFRFAGGAPAAADAIEELLAAKSSTTSPARACSTTSS